MKAYLSVVLTSALIFGASTLAYGASRKSGNSANHASTSHRSHGATHHHSTGSHHTANSGSKTRSNVPSN
jgi:hypothetical protein